MYTQDEAPEGDSQARFAFNKMTFTSEQSDSKIDVNDKHFWEKLMNMSEGMDFFMSCCCHAIVS